LRADRQTDMTKQIATFAVLPKILKIVNLFDACALRHIHYNMYELEGRKKMLIVTPQPPSRGNEPRYPLNGRLFGRQSRSSQVLLQYLLRHPGSKYMLRAGHSCKLRCFLCANALQFFRFIHRQSICFGFYLDRPHIRLLNYALHICTHFVYCV